MKLIEADLDDAKDICELLNISYRGDVGWTTEKNIVSGNRTSINDIALDISNRNSSVFLLHRKESELIACIKLNHTVSGVEIGSFAVRPSYQNQGVGNKVLSAAEAYAASKFKVSQLSMYVVSGRNELISFYTRRGYQLTGELQEFPVSLGVGIPTVPGLTIERLVKNA